MKFDSGNLFVIHGAQSVVDITKVDLKEDLVIWLLSGLSFPYHHQLAAKRGLMTLEMIKRTFPRIDKRAFHTLYRVYIRPLLEYANQVVYTGLKKDILAIERVQRVNRKPPEIETNKLTGSGLVYLVDLRSHIVAESALRTPIPEATPSLIAADDLSNIFWFIQVSDLHISVFDKVTRVTDFENFCENNIKIIRPELLIVSGDLTDAKTPNKHASLQLKSEWEIYASIIRKTKLLNITHWLDIRGNHDSFNVPRLIDDV
ncbi:uncharacterized protein DEA37_0011547, partial [Paragonimus westermani]